MRIVAAAACLTITTIVLADPYLTQPLGIAVNVVAESPDSGELVVVSSRQAYFPAFVELGATSVLQPIDPNDASPLDVSFGAETIATTRTVNISFATRDQSPIFQQSFFDLLLAPVPDSLPFTYNLMVNYGVGDNEWDRGIVSQTITFWDNDRALYSNTIDFVPQIYAGVMFATGADASPAQPGYFDDSDGVWNRFTYTATYGIVPTPSSFGLFALAGLVTRRKR